MDWPPGRELSIMRRMGLSIRRGVAASLVFGLGIALAMAGQACSANDSESRFGNGGSGNSGGSGGGTGGAGGAQPDGGGGSLLDSGIGGSSGDGGPHFQGDPTTCDQAKQAQSYIGCDFWPTVVANNVWSTFDYAVVVANAGTSPADVTVTRNGSQIATATVAPNALQTIYLPWVAELKGPDTDTCGQAMPLAGTVKAIGGAYHLVSTSPVAVYQFNALEYAPKGGAPGKNWSSCPGNQSCPSLGAPIGCFSYSNDASLLLPSTTLTGNYRITGNHGWNAASLGAYFAVTATQDSTTVNVKVSSTGQIIAGGGIQATGPNGIATFTLNAGDVAEVLGGSGDNSDLSGSLVQADKPVQVIAGQPCVNEPLDVSACDHIEESVFPAETLGKHYIVARPSSSIVPATVGHAVRIVGNQDGTQLTYAYSNGQSCALPTTINAGQVVEKICDVDFEVTGDKEFAVSTILIGAEVVDSFNGKGDPSLSNATTVEQYRTKYVFLAPNDYDLSFVVILMPTDAKVQVDGAPIGVTPVPIGTNGFGVARVQLGPGQQGAHVLTSDKSVGIQVIGYGSYTTYQYPGGLNLYSIAPPPPPIH